MSLLGCWYCVFLIKRCPLQMFGQVNILVLVVVALFSLAAGQSTVYQSFFKQGSNCTVTNGQRDSFFETGWCQPSSNPDNCNGKSACGVIYSCTATTVTLSYWYVNGDVCTRNEPEQTRTFPTNACLAPSVGYDSFNADSIFTCKV